MTEPSTPGSTPVPEHIVLSVFCWKAGFPAGDRPSPGMSFGYPLHHRVLFSPLGDHDYGNDDHTGDCHGDDDEDTLQVILGGGPDGSGPGRRGHLFLISSAIFLVVDWPSDWFPVTLTVKIPAQAYRYATGRSEDVVMYPSFQSTLTRFDRVAG